MLRSVGRTPFRCIAGHYQKRHSWNNLVNFFGPKIEDAESIPILFSTTNVFKDIKAYSDKEYGGGSTSQVTLVHSENEGAVIRWSGNVNFGEEHSSKSKAQGGFVAVKMFCKEYIDMLDYEGLKFQIRSKSDRAMLLNMKCKSYIQQDLYQLGVDVPAGDDWKTVFAPFNSFVLTAHGKVKEQPKENDSLQLETLGFLMTTSDTPNGEFEIEIRNMTVCNK